MIRSTSPKAFLGKGSLPLLFTGLRSFVLFAVLLTPGMASQPPEDELKKVEDLFGDFGAKEKGVKDEVKGTDEKKTDEKKPDDKKGEEKKPDDKNLKEDKKPDPEKKPESDAKVNKAQEALRSKRISVDVDELTLKEALAAISKEAEIEIVLDEEVLQGLTITADTKISAVLPKSMLLRSALKVVLERHGLKAVVEGESIRIAQNENGPAAAPMRIDAAAQVEQSEEQLTNALKVELAFLRRACNFTDADEPKLAAFDKKWLKKNSKVAASRVINGNMVAGSNNTLRASIEKALLKELEGVLTDEQKANYSKEREARTKFERDTQLRSIVLLLDQHLRLRNDQKQALLESLAKSYRDEIDMRTYLMNNTYLPQLPDAVILKHLDNEQKEIYRSIQKVTFGVGGQEAAVVIEK